MQQFNYPQQSDWTYLECGSRYIAVNGWTFHKGEVLRGLAFATLFEAVNHADEFKSLLQCLNGHFAIYVEAENFKAAAVDVMRSIPLLFENQTAKINMVFDLDAIQHYKMEREAVQQFQHFWCCLDNQTLLQNILQLQAGQFLWFENNQLNIDFYAYNYELEKQSQPNKQKGAELIQQVFEEYLPLIGNRKVVVPLSGGYDSRLVLTALLNAGYKNLMAYTYGDANSHEVRIAKQVAEQLQIEWHFVEYNAVLFQTFFSATWQAYSKSNHFYSSLPHEQDFFALYHLQQHQLLPKDFVAIPGFCGDLLGGSITANYTSDYSLQGLMNHIESKQNCRPAIDVSLEINDKSSFYDAYQQLFVCNKVSKFIVNAARVFTFFGGDYLLPLWDKRLLEYFYSLPIELREQQIFYNDILFEHFFGPRQIAFQKPAFDDNYPSIIKAKLKSMLPKQVTKSIQRWKQQVQSTDVNNLQVLNQLIVAQLEDKSQFDREINNSHAKYFLQNLKK